MKICLAFFFLYYRSMSISKLIRRGRHKLWGPKWNYSNNCNADISNILQAIFGGWVNVEMNDVNLLRAMNFNNAYKANGGKQLGSAAVQRQNEPSFSPPPPQVQTHLGQAAPVMKCKWYYNKSCPCASTEHHARKPYWGSGGIVSRTWPLH